jgi:hypothetical protein
LNLAEILAGMAPKRPKVDWGRGVESDPPAAPIVVQDEDMWDDLTHGEHLKHLWDNPTQISSATPTVDLCQAMAEAWDYYMGKETSSSQISFSSIFSTKKAPPQKVEKMLLKYKDSVGMWVMRNHWRMHWTIWTLQYRELQQSAANLAGSKEVRINVGDENKKDNRGEEDDWQRVMVAEMNSAHLTCPCLHVVATVSAKDL